MRSKRVDEALSGVSNEAAQEVRRAILENEHVSVSRRFRDFVRDHVDDRFFREEAKDRKQPPSRRELIEAVRNAYALRSRYVHVLERAPRELTALGRDNDMTRLETGCHLTLAGISRLARHVIFQVVERGVAVETETYAYRFALPNIVRARMAASMWLGHPDALKTVSAKGHLEACLEQFTAVLIGRSKEPVCDLRPILESIETGVGSATATDRLYLLTVYGIWHCAMAPQFHREDWRRLLGDYSAELDAATPTTLAAHVMLGIPLDWPVEKMVAARDAHVSAKGKNRLEVPQVLDAAIDLTVAEALRASGDEAGAKTLIAAAVESYPGCEALITFEALALQNSPLHPIDWEVHLRASDADVVAEASERGG
jgi:hypothetical protein